MAKAAKTVTGKLAGKAVAFVGKIGYKDMLRAELAAVTAREGGTVVDGEKTAPDYLVQGDGVGGKPPAASAKIQKKHPGAAVIDVPGFYQLVAPTADEILAVLQGGRRDYDFWKQFDENRRRAAGKIDLSGADLHGADLYGAKLESLTLDGADLRGANVEYAYLTDLHRVTLDAAHAVNLYLGNAEVSTFRGANLHKVWMFWGSATRLAGCDFGGAAMAWARGSRGSFADCTFAGADLSDADLAGATFTGCDFSTANLTCVRAHKARFAGAKFAGAKLHRADLRETSLRGADLRNADLRQAALGGADLTDAKVAGADLAGAVLTGANLTSVDFSEAKNYTPPAPRQPGPKLLEFEQAAVGAAKFSTTARVDLVGGETAACEFHVGKRGIHAAARHYRGGDDTHFWITAPGLAHGLLNAADRWPGGTLRLDTVTAAGSPTVRGPKLQELAVAAWAEAFGVSLATPDLTGQKDEQRAAALEARDALMTRMRAEGAGPWKALGFREQRLLNLRGADLGGARLSGLDATSHDFTGARFAGADLSYATLYGCTFQTADFTRASMPGAKLQGCKCESACFVDANLRGAYLEGAKLHGADFTGATLTGADLTKAQFDERTKFPAGFTIPDTMLWKGDGPRPGATALAPAAPGSVDFATFLKNLPTRIDASRIRKAAAMLKAERFQLYADVTDAHLVGVVKSQSSKELVYSCRLAGDGQFCCGTQNLKPCGGLAGSLCKHLVVLVVGLAKAGKLDPAVADNWVAASKAHKPTLQKEALSETFLRYKGAEAGEVDWRPTETVPEDFYAM